jgi:hypothetical protein
MNIALRGRTTFFGRCMHDQIAAQIVRLYTWVSQEKHSRIETCDRVMPWASSNDVADYFRKSSTEGALTRS